MNPIMDDYGVEDELNPPEEPFEGSFTRLMDIALEVKADEEQTQVCTHVGRHCLLNGSQSIPCVRVQCILQASNIFDTACAERIQQFDDAESDEDDDSSTWNDKEIAFISPVEQERYASLSWCTLLDISYV